MFIDRVNLICFLVILDDEPDPGPNSYIVITGYNDTEVLSHLTQIGVAVDVLIKFKCTLSSDHIDTETDGKLFYDFVFYNTVYFI